MTSVKAKAKQNLKSQYHEASILDANYQVSSNMKKGS
jgi:hypothetical protein